MSFKREQYCYFLLVIAKVKLVKKQILSRAFINKEQCQCKDVNKVTIFGSRMARSTAVDGDSLQCENCQCSYSQNGYSRQCVSSLERKKHETFPGKSRSTELIIKTIIQEIFYGGHSIPKLELKLQTLNFYPLQCVGQGLKLRRDWVVFYSNYVLQFCSSFSL